MRSKEATEELLTSEQAAEIIGISRAAIYIAAKQGRLPAVQILGRLAFRRADVESYKEIAGRRNGYIKRTARKQSEAQA